MRRSGSIFPNRRAWKQTWRRFAREEKGGVLVLFAALLPVLVAVAGLVIDTAVIAYHQAKLADAADSAAWAALDSYDRSLWNVDPPAEPTVVLIEDDARRLAEEYLDKNFPQARLTGISVGRTTVQVRAEVTCSFTFMKLFGMEGTTLHASAEAQMED
jgi:hypothetical protein